MKKTYPGKWRIVEMELWDSDFIDLVVPGYISFKKDNSGEFQFGAVNGCLDCRVERWGDNERIEFSWAGYDENDPVCGRGWAELKGDELHGRIFFHQSDDSGFVAKKA